MTIGCGKSVVRKQGSSRSQREGPNTVLGPRRLLMLRELVVHVIRYLLLPKRSLVLLGIAMASTKQHHTALLMEVASER